MAQIGAVRPDWPPWYGLQADLAIATGGYCDPGDTAAKQAPRQAGIYNIGRIHPESADLVVAIFVSGGPPA